MGQSFHGCDGGAPLTVRSEPLSFGRIADSIAGSGCREKQRAVSIAGCQRR